jgi:predicted RNase H-like nuclease
VARSQRDRGCIDACKKGWIAVAVRESGSVDAHDLSAIDDLAAAIPDASAIAVDIPIGLPEKGRPRADVEAKALLGPRRNSVFFTPVRRALEAPTHAEAAARSLQLTDCRSDRMVRGWRSPELLGG